MKRIVVTFLTFLLMSTATGVNAADINRSFFDFECEDESNLSLPMGFDEPYIDSASAGNSVSVKTESHNEFMNITKVSSSKEWVYASVGGFAAEKCARIKYRVRFNSMNGWHSLYLNADGQLVSLGATGNGFCLNWGTNGIEKLDAPVVIGEWYDICILLSFNASDSEKVKIYVDGVLKATTGFRNSSQTVFNKCEFYYYETNTADFDIDDLEICTYENPEFIIETPGISDVMLNVGTNSIDLKYEDFTGMTKKVYPFLLLFRDDVMFKAFCQPADAPCCDSDEQHFTFTLEEEDLSGNVTAAFSVWDGFDTRRSLLGKPILLTETEAGNE